MTPKERRANPASTQRRRITLRGSFLAGLVLCASLALAWTSWPSHAPSPAVPSPRELSKALFAAIRDGDHAQVQKLLAQGADVNARNDLGETALMEAAINADVPMMRLLIERGADVNAPRPQGDLVLMLAVHDPDKVRLLLEHGSYVEDRAMLLAASLPGSRPTLELLIRGGGNVNVNMGGVTALTCAAYCGDLDAVQFLLKHGGDVHVRTAQGFTPLIEAALSGNADIVRLFLDLGADPNARAELKDTFLTPLLAAVLREQADCVKPLLDRGADANIQGGPYQRSALLCAATTGNEEIVRLLLAKGANVQVADWEGGTPLTWAKRRGETGIVQLLRNADASGQEKEEGGRKDDKEPTRLPASVSLDPAAVSSAVTKSLPLLQRGAVKFTNRRGCVSCHHQSAVALAASLARAHGFAIDQEIADQQRAHILRRLGAMRGEILLGQALSDPPLAAWVLWSLGAEGQEPNPVTDALVHFLVLHQTKDGSWKTRSYRPPADGSHFAYTALALRGLQLYAPKGRGQEIEPRLARARSWLLHTTAMETEDKASRLLGLGWAEAGAEPIREAVALLLREQREDGGWAQLPGLPSDAYATGQVLYALHEGGKFPVTDPAYQRGVNFLLRTQLADGSWLVRTRAFPVLEYFNSGFPHGRSQFISASATCWATMALALTVPSRDDYPAQAAEYRPGAR
jgi:ankyrin repeat protein